MLGRKIKSFKVERVGELGKFFGFGICQKTNIKLIDVNRELNFPTSVSFKLSFGFNDSYISPYPSFKVTEVHRDENTNELSITAYDKLYWAVEHTIAELNLPDSYTIGDVALACGTLLGASDTVLNGYPEFNIDYPTGANFEGTETLRAVLDDIAEATQTIYYFDYNNRLIFKRL